eukprot:COSAG01_NODE_57821_length_309_cov_39.419048_1_plen_54_part_10
MPGAWLAAGCLLPVLLVAVALQLLLAAVRWLLRVARGRIQDGRPSPPSRPRHAA